MAPAGLVQGDLECQRTKPEAESPGGEIAHFFQHYGRAITKVGIVIA